MQANTKDNDMATVTTKKFFWMAALATGMLVTGAMTTSCSKDNDNSADKPDEPVVINPPVNNTVDLSKLTKDYTAQDGNVLTGTLSKDCKVSIEAGATVTLSGVSINADVRVDGYCAGITCLGDATIILADGTTNTVKSLESRFYPCIQAGPEGTTLTIRGTGKLIANHSQSSGSAVIGGGYYYSCGNIRIEGGEITVTGQGDGAGIGSGSGHQCGNISITGGTITAKGGDAGIGCGFSATCGDITITGGTVYAQGGADAAGIGSGSVYRYKSKCGNISITGGTVTATGGNNAAGIGCGHGEWDIPSSSGNITISWSKDFVSVKAVKGSGALRPIGLSRSGLFYNSCGPITFGGKTIYKVEYGEESTYRNIDDGTEYDHLRLSISTTKPENANSYDNSYNDNTWTLTPL